MSFDEPFQFEKTNGYLPWPMQEKYKGAWFKMCRLMGVGYGWEGRCG